MKRFARPFTATSEFGIGSEEATSARDKKKAQAAIKEESAIVSFTTS